MHMLWLACRIGTVLLQQYTNSQEAPMPSHAIENAPLRLPVSRIVSNLAISKYMIGSLFVPMLIQTTSSR